MASLMSLTKSSARCSDLLCCFYDLNELESRLFYTVAARPGITLDDLSVRMGRDRSTVFRCLQKLSSVGLIYREMDSLDRGGRISRYYPSDFGEIRKMIEGRIDALKASMQKLLDDFEKRMKIEMEIFSE